MKNKKTLKLLISVLLVLVLTFGSLNALSILVEDKLSDGRFLDRQNQEEFYGLKKNSVDVLAVGTSQVMSGFSACELFGQYGISSFGIGTCSQPLFSSYYWLLEAFKTQSPKVVLLEMSSLFGKNVANEMSFYKSLCSMKNTSKYKAEALKIVDEEIISGGIDKLAYYSNLYKFHSRWSEIGKSDYAFLYDFDRKTYCGSAVLEEIVENEKSRKDIEVELIENTTAPNEELSVVYLEKIIELCKEKNIELILFKTPKYDWGSNQYTVTTSYAQKHDLTYFDFNTPSLLNELEIDMKNDFADVDHLNYQGAKKVTTYLGNYLNENFELEDHRQDSAYKSYSETYEEYLETYNSAILHNTSTFSSALDCLDSHDNYCFVLAKRGSINVSDDISKKLERLNITEDFSANTYFSVSIDETKIDSIHTSENPYTISGYYSNFTNYQIVSNSKKIHVGIFGKNISSDLDSCVLLSVYDKNLKRVVYTGVFDGNLEKE